jgi:hypothetical protein
MDVKNIISLHAGTMLLTKSKEHLVGLCIVEVDGDTIPVHNALTKAIFTRKTVCTKRNMHVAEN